MHALRLAPSEDRIRPSKTWMGLSSLSPEPGAPAVGVEVVTCLRTSRSVVTMSPTCCSRTHCGALFLPNGVRSQASNSNPQPESAINPHHAAPSTLKPEPCKCTPEVHPALSMRCCPPGTGIQIGRAVGPLAKSPAYPGFQFRFRASGLCCSCEPQIPELEGSACQNRLKAAGRDSRASKP